MMLTSYNLKFVKIVRLQDIIKKNIEENEGVNVLCKKRLFCFFPVRMKISIPRDNCFGDGNFDLHLKPIEFTYSG